MGVALCRKAMRVGTSEMWIIPRSIGKLLLKLEFSFKFAVKLKRSKEEPELEPIPLGDNFTQIERAEPQRIGFQIDAGGN